MQITRLGVPWVPNTWVDTASRPIASVEVESCAGCWCFTGTHRCVVPGGSCPHRERASNGRTCEEQNGCESVEVGFHEFFLWVLGFGFYVSATSPLWQPHKCVSIG